MLLPALLLLLQQQTPVPPAPAGAPAPARRREVTTAVLSDAYRDSATQSLFLLARRARLQQDAALRGYDAKTQARITARLGTSVLTRNRLLFRTENVSNVRWRRGQGMLIEPLASRTTVPMSKNVNVNGVASELIPVPYFPGRDQLWIPSSNMGVVKRDVDESEGFVHPLAEGSEAYYRYQIGDSIQIRLPSGEPLVLRELKVLARKPEWRSFVGSFWFDSRTGALVRAAYRLSAPMEIWSEALADAQKEIAEAERDTSAGRAARVKEAREDAPPAFVRNIVNPLRFDVSLVTVEYALYEGKFWLPRVNRAEGSAQAMFLKVPVTIEESYKYDDVDGTTPLPPMPAAVQARQQALATMQVCAPQCDDVIEDQTDDTRATRVQRRLVTDSLLRANGLQPALIADTSTGARRVRSVGDSLYKAYRDGTLAALKAERVARRDSLLRVAGRTVPAETDSTREARRTRSFGDSLYRDLRRKERRSARDAECKAGNGYYTTVRTRYEGALQYAVKVPCDSTVLASSKELPESPYDPNEDVFSQRDAAALANALSLSLQPMFGPQPLQFDYSLRRQRYNRVEGLSLGAGVTWPLGAGYTASGSARIGLADRQPNAEVAMARSNGRATLQAGAYRRLNVSNDFGDPLSLGASMASLLYGRDEGFYYRALGTEVTWTREGEAGRLRWRAFGEQQTNARKRTNLNLANAFSDNRVMIDNITARRGTVAGLAAEWQRAYGLNPDGWQVAADVRAEGAGGSFNYGRGLAEFTISRPIVSKLSFAQTVSGGAATDSVPLQRQFFLGGLRTVRGQVAGSMVGNTYWLSRTEFGWGTSASKQAVFLDLGWAGDRGRLSTPGRPLAGYGAGSSFVDGLFRVDVAQGIYPRKGLRIDLSLGARF
jgi:hypothetical protein